MGFAESLVECEESDRVVAVRVLREGDTSFEATVEYRTIDGSAAAGQTYHAA